MNPRKRISSQTPAVMQTSTHQCRSVWVAGKKYSNDLQAFAERYVRGRLFSFFQPTSAHGRNVMPKTSAITASTRNLTQSCRNSQAASFGVGTMVNTSRKPTLATATKLATHSHILRVL